MRVFASVCVGCALWTVAASAAPSANPKSSQVPATNVEIQSACPDYPSMFEHVVPMVVSVASGEMISSRFTAKEIGSGFVWDDANHVVTALHVLGGGKLVRVRTTDARVLTAQVIASDDTYDLAVLRVDGLKLKPLPLGDISKLRLGQSIASVGNPYGLESSVNVGVVSAIGRRLPDGATSYRGAYALTSASDDPIQKLKKSGEFLQTNLPLNSGDSGGPLLNIAGEVIGLNVAIYQGGQGISFSIPIDRVRVVTEALLKSGVFKRGYAGLFLRPVPPKNAREAGLEKQMGARILSVVPGRPADLAGLKVDDIVLKFDGREVVNESALTWIIASTPPGKRVQVEIARKLQRLNLSLTVTAQPNN